MNFFTHWLQRVEEQILTFWSTLVVFFSKKTVGEVFATPSLSNYPIVCCSTLIIKLFCLTLEWMINFWQFSTGYLFKKCLQFSSTPLNLCSLLINTSLFVPIHPFSPAICLITSQRRGEQIMFNLLKSFFLPFEKKLQWANDGKISCFCQLSDNINLSHRRSFSTCFHYHCK